MLFASLEVRLARAQHRHKTSRMKSRKSQRYTQSSSRTIQASHTTARTREARRPIFAALLALVPVLLLALLELGLRVFGYGDDLALAHKVREGGREWWAINQNVARRYFGMQPEFARQAEAGRVAVLKPRPGYRVICLGESSMAGFPYNLNATMPGILRTYLQILFPNHEIEVVNLGIAATNSFAVLDLMPEVLALQPDVILVYVGHNEFYGALGVGSTFSQGRNRNLIKLSLQLLHYRTFRLLQEVIREAMRLSRATNGNVDWQTPVMQQMAQERTIPWDSKLIHTAGRILEQNLREAIAQAQAARVPIVVSEVVSNLKDQAPFVSVFTPTLSRAQKQEWQQAFARGEQLMQSGQIDSALINFAEASRLDSLHAGLAFAQAGCRLLQRDSSGAARLFSRARDLDALRFRAPSTFNAILRRVCGAQRVSVVETERHFRQRSAAGIIGREIIAEHVHPTVHGYVLLAKAFLLELQAAGRLPVSRDASQIAALPEDLRALNITVLDEEIGRLRIHQLTSQWPFPAAVDLHVDIAPQLAPVVKQFAVGYINRELTWADAHLKLAERFAQMKEHELALAEYRALTAQFPAEFSLWDKQGETLLSLQRYQEAIPAFSRSLACNPESPFARVGMGKAFMFLSRFAEAEAALAEAVNCDDRLHQFAPAYRSFVFYLWGGALTNLKNYAPAEQKLVEALRLDANNKLARNFLAKLQAQGPEGRGRREKSVE